MLGSLIKSFQQWRSTQENPPHRRLYATVVAQAREPVFFQAFGVPDSIDGRFEMVVLHVFLVLHRLKGQGETADRLGQRLLETMVEDFDISIRELGIGDSGVKRRVRAMLRGFAGRLAAYHNAFAAADDLALDVALDNNLYGTVATVPAHQRAAMTAYLRRTVGHLAGQPLDGLLAGTVAFAVPVPAGGSLQDNVAIGVSHDGNP